jgi:hypothetical protein
MINKQRTESTLDLVELTVRIRCKCGNGFLANEFNDIDMCNDCKRQYRVHITFQEFHVGEV